MKKYIKPITFFLITVITFVYIGCSKKTNPVEPSSSSDGGSGGGTTVSLVGTWVYQLNTGNILYVNADGTYEVKTNNVYSEKGTWQDNNPYFVGTKQYLWNGSDWSPVSEPTNFKIYYLINGSSLYLSIYFSIENVSLYKRLSGSTGIVGEWETYWKSWTTSYSQENRLNYNFDASGNLVITSYSNGIKVYNGTNVYEFNNDILKKGIVISGVTNWYESNSAYIISDTWFITGPMNGTSPFPVESLGYLKQ